MQNRRRNYFVNQSLQLKSMGWVLAILVVGCVSTMVFLQVMIWNRAMHEFSDESVRNMFQTTSRLHDYEEARFATSSTAVEPRLAFLRETQLYSQRQREIITTIVENARAKLILVTMPLLLIVGLGTILLSHRIAGPLYRFQKSLAEIAQKNLTVRIHLRKHDEGQAIADTFNQALGELDQSLSKIKKAVQETQDFAQLRNEITNELDKFKTS